MSPFFSSEDIVDFKSAQSSDTEKFKTFFWNMIENGVFLPPSQFEAWFLSTVLSNKDLKNIEKAIKTSMKAVADKHNS
jgi:glutamate-1-semialdehyde 2,1-aminomutase